MKMYRYNFTYNIIRLKIIIIVGLPLKSKWRIVSTKYTNIFFQHISQGNNICKSVVEILFFTAMKHIN